jgi:LysR family glycine cleavage system transcriptional activator
MVELNRFHLNGLRAIEIVARQGTLARAAGELGTSTGAVSQLVIKAEKQLGRQVFHRLPAGLKLTPFGIELVTHLEAGFSAIAKGVAGAIETQSHVLRVSTTLSFAEKWLVPRLPDFQSEHQNILVEIDAGVQVKDLVRSKIDVALRFGKGDWPGVKAEHLCSYRVFPVCSPAYAKRLSTPADLSTATIIRHEGASESWEDWAREAKFGDRLPTGITFNEYALCINAAIAGLGAALGLDLLLADDLQAGRLVAPFESFLVSEYGFWSVTSKSRGGDAKI